MCFNCKTFHSVSEQLAGKAMSSLMKCASPGSVTSDKSCFNVHWIMSLPSSSHLFRMTSVIPDVVQTALLSQTSFAVAKLQLQKKK